MSECQGLEPFGLGTITVVQKTIESQQSQGSERPLGVCVFFWKKVCPTRDVSTVNTRHYPNDVDSPLNESVTDKIRAYHGDYNNRPSKSISFVPTIPSTWTSAQVNLWSFYFYKLIGTLTVFFTASGVQLPQPTSGLFHRSTFSSQLKSKVDNILTKTTALRINLNNDGSYIF
jgi:hypothetical protein